MDKISLAWAVFVILVGVTALLRSASIEKIMKNVHAQSRVKEVLTAKELHDRTSLYIRLFGAIWILSGLFWLFWLGLHPHR